MNVEKIFVGFSLGSDLFMIGGIYIPPHSHFNTYKYHYQTVESVVRQ